MLFLLPVVAVLAWILWAASRPRFDDSAAILGDTLTGSRYEKSDAAENRDRPSTPASNRGYGDADAAPKLFAFDPNTATYEDFRELGIPKGTAAGIIKYRERGKVFQISEDFAACYGITDSMYAALKSYIDIGERFRLKPSPDRGAKYGAAQVSDAADEPGAAPGYDNASSATAKVDINTADSAMLVQVRGIGAKSAAAIIIYREKLGGFHSVEQLAELPVVTERNYELMREQIWADSCEIQKIDINFAPPNTVAGHPYMAGKKARKILKNRQLKGGWSTIEDMIEDHTLTSGEAAKLAPYLRFTAIGK